MSKKGKPNPVYKKYHYVYKLVLKYDRRYYYIGKRSTNKKDDSSYLGSGKGLIEYKKKFGKNCFEKEILSYWGSSDEAFEEESRLVTREVVNDKFCLNRIIGGGSFDTTGCKWRKRTPEEIEKSRQNRLGKKQPIEARKKVSEKIKKLWENEEYREKQKNGRRGKYINHLNKISKERIGKITIEKDGHRKFVSKEELNAFLKSGWHKKSNIPSIEKLLNLREKGLSYSKIGKMFGVTESAIRSKIRRHNKMFK